MFGVEAVEAFSVVIGYILPELLQPAGKPRMAVRDYLNGWKPRGECRCV